MQMPLLLLLLALLAIGTLNHYPICENDLFWMIRAGEEIARGHAVQTVELEHHAAGATWYNFEWLSTVLFWAWSRLAPSDKYLPTLRALLAVSWPSKPGFLPGAIWHARSRRVWPTPLAWHLSRSRFSRARPISASARSLRPDPLRRSYHYNDLAQALGATPTRARGGHPAPLGQSPFRNRALGRRPRVDLAAHRPAPGPRRQTPAGPRCPLRHDGARDPARMALARSALEAHRLLRLASHDEPRPPRVRVPYSVEPQLWVLVVAHSHGGGAADDRVGA